MFKGGEIGHKRVKFNFSRTFVEQFSSLIDVIRKNPSLVDTFTQQFRKINKSKYLY